MSTDFVGKWHAHHLSHLPVCSTGYTHSVQFKWITEQRSFARLPPFGCFLSVGRQKSEEGEGKEEYGLLGVFPLQCVCTEKPFLHLFFTAGRARATGHAHWLPCRAIVHHRHRGAFSLL